MKLSTVLPRLAISSSTIEYLVDEQARPNPSMILLSGLCFESLFYAALIDMLH